MSILSENIRHLRKIKGLTQKDLAEKINATRSIIGAYEEDRAEPKLQTLQNMAQFFGVSIDGLLNSDLSKADHEVKVDMEGAKLRVLNVVVSERNSELISVVPIKAAAGYLNGYADREYIEELPRFSLPVSEVSQNRTYRIFQIKGDSMLPIQPNSYIITEYVENWRNVKDDKCYVVVTKEEGVVYKRVMNKVSESNELVLKSDNATYPAYNVNINDVVEIWRATGYMSFNLPNQDDLSFDKLSSLVIHLRDEMDKLKSDKISNE